MKRTSNDIAIDFLKRMYESSHFNSVEWVRFKDIQLEDFVKSTPEYISKSGGNHYLYRQEKYAIKASIKKALLKLNVKFNGDEYKIAKFIVERF